MKFQRRVFYISLIILLLPFSSLFAANDSLPNDDDTCFTRNLLVSIDYGSNKTFLGRSASVNQVYLSPSLSYEAPSGFFVSVVAYRLISPKKRWDELDLNIGWDFFLFKKKLEASVGYSHFTYGKQSQQLSSVFNNNVEFILRKGFGHLKSKLFLDYDFGNGSTDYSFTLDNSYPVIFENVFADDDELKIKPQVSLSAGTLNFYKIKLKNQGDTSAQQNASATVDTRFNLTGIEFSFPLEYNIGRFTFEPAVHHNIPLNQPKRLKATAVTYFTMSIGFSII